MKWDYNVAIAIDFDLTITNRKGQVRKNAKWAFNQLKKIGCKLILWTSRTTEGINEAKDILNREEMVFDFYNEYPLRENNGKISCDIYIDDRSTFGIVLWGLYVIQAKIIMHRRKKKIE